MYKKEKERYKQIKDYFSPFRLRPNFIFYIMHFNQNLPIQESLSTLHTQLDMQSNVIVVAPPGTGKTTLVPLSLLFLNRAVLLHVQQPVKWHGSTTKTSEKQ